MKKVISLTLALIIALFLCACSSGYLSMDPLKRTVENEIIFNCMMNYEGVTSTNVSITNIEESDGYFYIKGKVYITDEYGDKYVGKFDAEYVLDGEEYEQTDLYIETPKKEN